MWSITLNVTDFSHHLFFQCFMLNHIVLFFYYTSYSWTTTFSSFWKKRMRLPILYTDNSRKDVEKKEIYHPYKCLKPCHLITKIYMLFRKHLSSFGFMWCSFLCVTFLLEKREITSSTPQQGGIMGDLFTLTATADSHHKDLSFVCSNKENFESENRQI